MIDRDELGKRFLEVLDKHGESRNAGEDAEEHSYAIEHVMRDCEECGQPVGEVAVVEFKGDSDFRFVVYEATDGGDDRDVNLVCTLEEVLDRIASGLGHDPEWAVYHIFDLWSDTYLEPIDYTLTLTFRYAGVTVQRYVRLCEG